MSIKAVLFDLGDTLLYYHDSQEIDPRRPFRRVVMLGGKALSERLIADRFKLPAFEDFWSAVDRRIGRDYVSVRQDLRGWSIEKSVRAALAEIGLDIEEDYWNELRRLFYSPIDEIVFPRDGVRETLSALQADGYKLGLISNTYWAADLHDRHLIRHQLIDFLPIRIYSCDMPYAKPHPSIFRAALEALDVAPAEVTFVGDTPSVDVFGAQGAGLRGVLIHSPYREVENGDEVIPDAVIDELSDLISTLGSLQAAV